ncbi:SIMPL domain-containing protein [Trichococcus collinsii]|uniref:DUF541 domain-containing protein n=1 Tax=Trichococcus collinsii TaxID=157076 RepID=A0AB38A0B3_9LACT|nr:SIMPL domain-containing protein [Trichococcus collinsii]CZQ89239.1 Hypothetical protein Tcol_900 [Trichococcus collinsii]SEA48075.1 hypothetical protein SAMN04488525_103204 [Trichococcus collinsii]
MEISSMTVKGKGSASAPPDAIAISLQLEGIKDTYELAMQHAALELEQVRETLLPLGFSKKEIRSTHFSIDSAYEHRNDFRGENKRYFLGYRYRNDLKIIFENDSKRLGEILWALSTCEASPEFSVYFFLQNRQAVEQALLEDAVRDAKGKAQILAAAGGVMLGKILSIDYDWGEIEVRSRVYAASAKMAYDSTPMIDLEPEDISNSDTVTVVWEILNPKMA